MSLGYLMGMCFFLNGSYNLFLCQPDQVIVSSSESGMRVNTQIVKDIMPNTFPNFGKVFGVLFFTFIHFVSAYAIISDKKDLKKEVKINLVSDSISYDQKDSIVSNNSIYTTSGTTIINLENAAHDKIVILESTVLNSKNKSLAKRTNLRKVVKPVDNYKYIRKDSNNAIICFYKSSPSNLFYSVREAFIKAVVTSQDFSSKTFIKPILIEGYEANINLLKNKIYCFKEHILIEKYQSIFSGRAPPFFV